MHQEEKETNYKLRFIGTNLIAILAWTLIYIWFRSSEYYPVPAQFETTFVAILAFITWLSGVVTGFIWTFNDEWTLDSFSHRRHDDFYKRYTINFLRLPKFKFILVLLVLILGYTCYKIASNGAVIYNKSIVYTRAYEAKTQAKAGFYDKLWKTYLQKEKITNLNKETFIEVSRVIMENRKDGQSVTWKWVQENQHIPYNEFVDFYRDLSHFIEAQREAYYALEVECQSIAYQHNTLLDTFPNNFYNRIIGRPHLEFKYGFLSDSTIKVFNKGKEDVK
jgi:hypothetical protein